MNPVRLDIIQDDAVAAPRLSRVLPAVLYNIVPESSYTDFCNNIDSLLNLAAADYKVRAYRLLWSNLGIVFWSLWFCACFIGQMSHMDWDMNKADNIPDKYFYIMVASVIVCAIYMAVIRIWMNCSTGVTPATHTMREIRDECEAMTNRTPHASFHVVLTPLATALRGHYLHANPIAYIEVSVSVIGFELARTNLGMVHNEIPNASGKSTADASQSALSSRSPVTNDYQMLNIL